MDGQTKEEVYDAEVYPLMAQIIAICKRNKIAMLASFTLDAAEERNATAFLLSDEYQPHASLLSAREAMFDEQPSHLHVCLSDDSSYVKSRSYCQV